MVLSRWFCTASVVLAVCGCGTSPSPVYTPSSGSLALSRDDTFLYAVDSDNNFVSVVDAATLAVVAHVPVGARPERITVGSDDTLYVSNRGGRSVSVIHRGTWTEAARISVGVEPVGVAVSPDAKTLYVVNAATLKDPSVGSLMAVDTKTQQIRWELNVGEEPRGVALLANGNVVVGLYKQGDVVTVDPTGPAVVFNGTLLNSAANAGAGPSNTPPVPSPGPSGGETFHARGLASVTVAPDGKTLYAPLLWDSNAIVPLNSSIDPFVTVGVDGGPTFDGGNVFDAGDCGGGGYGGNGGGTTVGAPVGIDGGFFGPPPFCTPDPNAPGGPIVVPGIATFDGPSGTAKVDDVTGRMPATVADFPASMLRSRFESNGVQEPVAIAVDSTGKWLFVVNRASNDVAILPSQRAAPASGPTVDPIPFQTTPIAVRIDVGAGPTGIALTRDGKSAFVHNALDHSISKLQGQGGAVTAVGAPVQVATDTLPAGQVQGRKDFFSMRNPALVAPEVGISCGSCHLEGREDGQVWHFKDGPRQTPALVGRMLDQTAPYHWSGVLTTLHDFMTLTVSQRMGGTGITPIDEQQLLSYLVAAPAPDNALKGVPLTAQQQHGAQLFAQAQCGTCHSGPALTNNGFGNVGTQSADPRNPDDFSLMPNGLNVPSLLGIARSAPFLHDGSAATLKDRLTMSQVSDLHGKTSTLTSSDIDDLVAYLKTL